MHVYNIRGTCVIYERPYTNSKRVGTIGGGVSIRGHLERGWLRIRNGFVLKDRRVNLSHNSINSVEAHALLSLPNYASDVGCVKVDLSCDIRPVCPTITSTPNTGPITLDMTPIIRNELSRDIPLKRLLRMERKEAALDVMQFDFMGNERVDLSSDVRPNCPDNDTTSMTRSVFLDMSTIVKTEASGYIPTDAMLHDFLGSERVDLSCDVRPSCPTIGITSVTGPVTPDM